MFVAATSIVVKLNFSLSFAPTTEGFRLLTLNNISMRYGARILFDEVTTTFLSGRRYAITGPNGAGKSTLMKILTGELEPSKGDVTRPKRMGVLRQDQFAFDAFRVIDTVIMGNAPLWQALQEREKLYEKDHTTYTDEDGMRLGELEGMLVMLLVAMDC
jgi:ATPase subunit of ABC transporter with duplicated ATPase domains